MEAATTTTLKKTSGETPEEKAFDKAFESGLAVSFVKLHQATSHSLGTTTTLHANKPPLLGMEMSMTTRGLLIKHKNSRIGIPEAAVAEWKV